jgi:cell shape-determining protein MreC
MKPSECLARIEDLEAENKDLRKQLERTSRKLTKVQNEKKELQTWITKLTTKDHPARRTVK